MKFLGTLGTLLLASSLVACTTDDPTSPSSETLPQTTGTYGGRYDVPSTPELAAAATYPVAHVDWTVSGGIATLHYDLPLGLVGGDISITLSGPIEPGSTEVTVTGRQGVGTCNASGTVVTCREMFSNLGVLPIDPAVVETVALQQMPNAVSQRIAVANQFASDPIGIVIFDLTTPPFEDNLDPGHD